MCCVGAVEEGATVMSCSLSRSAGAAYEAVGGRACSLPALRRPSITQGATTNSACLYTRKYIYIYINIIIYKYENSYDY